VPRKDGNKWLVDLRHKNLPRVFGQKRLKRRFPTKPEANRFETWALNQLNQEQPWNPVTSDRRTLKDLCDRWFNVHGRSLADGQRRYDNLLVLCEMMGDPLAADVTGKMYADLRHARMTGEKSVSENTVNHELAYLKAVYNKLIELDEWRHANPLAKVKKLPFQATSMSWLEPEQIQALLPELRKSSNESVYWVFRICIGTGPRWGQGEAVKREQFIEPGKIWYPPHKRGTERVVPFHDPELVDYLKTTKRRGTLFTSCVGAFKKALERAEINLPAGQLTHVCRHTFATNQVRQGTDLVTLQHLLGHRTISETIKYAHFAPSALDKVPERSPLAEF